MNTSVASISSISTGRLWLSGASARYVLAGESPLRSDDETDCESVLSIQAKETDYVQDTSDSVSDDSTVEYEPVSDVETPPIRDDCSSTSSEQIITTRVISVVACSTTEAPADESAADDDSDVELGPHDYWRCVQCHNRNNNPRYRYCERCFKVRKTLLPPRPKRRARSTAAVLKHDYDSAYSSQELAVSQELAATSQELAATSQQFAATSQQFAVTNSREFAFTSSHEFAFSSRRGVKRPAVDLDNSKSDSEASAGAFGDCIAVPKCKEVVRLISKEANASSYASKLFSLEGNFQQEAVMVHSKIAGGTETKLDPFKSVSHSQRGGTDSEDESKGVDRLSRQAVTTLAAAAAEDSGACVLCCERPKSGVFVHGRVAHICCCYQCARKVFATTRRCPVCNRALTAVLRAVVS